MAEGRTTITACLVLALLGGCRETTPTGGATPPDGQGAPPAPLPATTGHLQVCGLLDGATPDYTFNSAKLEDFPLDDRARTSHLPGPYTMALLDGEGRVLSREQFGPMWGHAASIGPDGTMDCHPVEVPFTCMNVPFVPGTVGLEVRRDGSVLERYTRTPSVPRIRITAPAPGTPLPATGPLEVAWEASDADGDPLSHSIYFRAGPGDGGSGEWQALIGDFPDPRVELDAALFPPGPAPAPELLVLTTDRFNTARAVVKLGPRPE